MQITITREELYSMIKEAVREVIGEKEFQYIIHSFKDISDKEMDEINEKYGSPDNYRDVAFSENLDL